MNPLKSTLEHYLLENLNLDPKTVQDIRFEHSLYPEKTLSEIMIKKGSVTKEKILTLLSEKTSLPFLTREDLLEKAQPILSKDNAQKWKALALQSQGDKAQVALVDFDNLPLCDDIADAIKKPVRPFIMAEEDFAYVFEYLYGNKGTHTEKQHDEGISLLHDMISSGIRHHASDIHLQPLEDRIVIKNRVDGMLREERTLPKQAYAPLLSALKVCAHLDVGESRKPQHGRYLHPFADRTVDLRISTHPTILGENIVIRILDKMHGLKSLDELGFSKKMSSDLQKLVQQPSGMIIITGPTGSGKTTTLYALLRTLDHHKLNIMTLEDPVEYHIPGIRQTEVSQNLSYADGVKSLLRQDPDVILVGEIRDEETANMALRASMTGHLVLATLHTPDVFTVPARLRDLGISLDVLASNLLGMVSQRLLRKYCPKCGGNGCSECTGTGYQGRVSVGEYLIFDEASLQSLKSGDDLKKYAALTLQQDCKEKIQLGITSREEIQRVCGFE